MKKITAIVRPEKLEPLKEALFAAQVSGMTIAQARYSSSPWKTSCASAPGKPERMPCRRCGADRPYVAMRDGSVGAACWPPVASRRLRAGIPFTAVVFVIPRSRTGRFWRAHRKRRAIGRIGPVCGRSRERGGRS